VPGEIFGKTEQHNITETAASHADTIDEIALYTWLFLLQIFQADIRFVSYTGERFHYPSESGLGLPENDLCFFACKVNGYFLYAGIQPVQIFEEPEAGTAMNIGNVKGDMCLLIITELQQLLLNFFIIKEGEFIFSDRKTLCHSWFIIKRIIFTKVILVQYFIYQFTTLAAEMFIAISNAVVRTGFSAVIA
jgi:hypothetical protein